jgi:two-component system phosphate regulon sensor histidine kinase PhoR
LIANLLTFMQWESGEAGLRLEPVSLQVVLDAAVVVVGAAARAKGVKLTEEVPPDLPPILADAAALSDALGQLLENAVKFSPNGGQVTLTARRIEGQAAQVPDRLPTGGFVGISVRDMGAGISPEVIPRIFDRFYQADASATRRHGGTGLGLAIVKRVLDAHGARITVESRLGQGTTFSLQLPAAP